MPDKGIQIVVALLEKREQYIITKESNAALVNEILRAEELGYVKKEEKSGKYTLSEMGYRLVYSNYGQGGDFSEDTTRVINFPTPAPIVKLASDTENPEYTSSTANLGSAYASSFGITAFFLLTILVIRLLGLI